MLFHQTRKSLQHAEGYLNSMKIFFFVCRVKECGDVDILVWDKLGWWNYIYKKKMATLLRNWLKPLFLWCAQASQERLRMREEGKERVEFSLEQSLLLKRVKNVVRELLKLHKYLWGYRSVDLIPQESTKKLQTALLCRI